MMMFKTEPDHCGYRRLEEGDAHLKYIKRHKSSSNRCGQFS